MYEFSQIKSIHLEITSKCQARCPMCPRTIHGGMINPFMTLNEVTIEQFSEWVPVDLIRQLDHFNFCGNLGDPIVAKDTLKIILYLRTHNRTMSIILHTNGSARSSKWFKILASLRTTVIFGIDGLEDTHSIYRIGTNWKKIMENAKAFIEFGGDARWDMIIFEHNAHQVDRCKELAKRMRFREFQAKHTSRFKTSEFVVLDKAGKTVNILLPTQTSKNILTEISQAEQVSKPLIECKAKKDQQIYISANGNVSPCCWLDLQSAPPFNKGRIQFMDTIGGWPNLNTHTLKEIFESKYFNKIEQSWNFLGLAECAKQCGVFDKFNSQFTEKNNNQETQ